MLACSHVGLEKKSLFISSRHVELACFPSLCVELNTLEVAVVVCVRDREG